MFEIKKINAQNIEAVFKLYQKINLYNNYIITKPAEHACSRIKKSACMTAAKFSPPWAWAELFIQKKQSGI